jgi:hypothetical protein
VSPLRRLSLAWLIASTTALTCSWLACSSDDPTSSADAGVGPDGPIGNVDGRVEGPDTSVPDKPDGSLANVIVPSPTELLLHEGRIYVAGEKNTIHLWIPGALKADVFVSTTVPARELRAGFGNIYFIGESTTSSSVFVAPITGAGAGTAVLCRDPANTLAVISTRVVYAASGILSSTAASCQTSAGITSSYTTLIVADGETLLRYEPQVNGGRIGACAPEPGCGGLTTQLASSIGTDVTTMIVDATRIYWATPTAVFSKLKNTVGVATIATAQALPRTLATIDGMLYWTNYDNGTVMSAPIAGGTPPVALATGINHPWGLVATSDDLYVAATGSNSLLRYKR